MAGAWLGVDVVVMGLTVLLILCKRKSHTQPVWLQVGNGVVCAQHAHTPPPLVCCHCTRMLHDSLRLYN